MQVTEPNKRRFWLLFAILTELITLAIWWGKRPVPPDYFTYTRLADLLASGQGYLEHGKAFTFFPPGYPVFLMIIHSGADLFALDRPLTVIGVDLWVGAVTLLYFRSIARAILPPRMAEFATLLWATYAFQLVLYTQPNSEIPFLLTFLAAISYYIQYLKNRQLKDSFMGGLWLGISCLLRPITLYLSLILAFYQWWYEYQSKKTLRTSGLAILLWLGSFCVMILPWEGYVYAYNQEWIPVQGKSVLPIYEGLIFGHESYHGLPTKVSADVYAFMADVASESPTLPSLLEKIKAADPLVLVKLLGYKMVRSWYGLWDNPNEKPVQYLQAVYLFMALTGIVRSFRRRYFSWLLFLPFLLMMYYWGTTILIIPLLRYMIPAMPFVMIYVALACMRTLKSPAGLRS